MDDINLSNAMLYADSAHGVYTPQYFALSIKRECVSGVSNEQWETLERGPNFVADDSVYPGVGYWDTWNDVDCNAIATDPSTGVEYGLYQDGDLWLVPLADLCASDLEED